MDYANSGGASMPPFFTQGMAPAQGGFNGQGPNDVLVQIQQAQHAALAQALMQAAAQSNQDLAAIQQKKQQQDQQGSPMSMLGGMGGVGGKSGGTKAPIVDGWASGGGGGMAGGDYISF